MAPGASNAGGFFVAAVTQRSKLQSPERLAIVAATWGTMMPTREILALLNAAPGPEGRVTNDQAHRWGVRCGAYRPKELSSAQRQATFRGNYARPEAMSSAEREPLLRSLATIEWPYERLELLCVEWNKGTLTAEMGVMLRCSRGATLGKARRLVEVGALISRLSPIIFQDALADGVAAPPVTRAVNIVDPIVTLPTLPSLAGVTLVEEWRPTAGRRGCQYVTQEGSLTTSYELCGAATAPGCRSWCPTHRQLVFLPRRRAAA